MTSPVQRQTDLHFMEQAIEQARSALSSNEVPVGAVLVVDGHVVSSAHNRCVSDHDPTGHAEILAIKTAASLRRVSRLDTATLYVTLEPCLMCCGAIVQARIARLVYGAREPRTGGVVSLIDSLRIAGLDHHVAITEGVMAEESAALMREFFAARRG